MIVRIMGEGQFRLPDLAVSRLNELDEQLDADIRDDGEADLAHHLHLMYDVVREMGQPLAHDELEPSDCILPPPEVSLDELRELLSEEGLVPG